MGVLSSEGDEAEMKQHASLSKVSLESSVFFSVSDAPFDVVIRVDVIVITSSVGEDRMRVSISAVPSMENRG